ncbi:nucleosome assembly protein 1-like 1-B [Diabrotica virgifera virgifera]|uniref:Nucleosome assembly protein 1-like 1 n=1 Tax=Diabrotica virgifera virgifera TaxID=50390 RepID=A0ABM5KS74_DIAVI|nr:nucleosome assembly protein 1-like 1-B [Diabrotica virgifera virgifera]XP_050513040.1 nucleosome assembly protein 1-like 1-B [Diabrotica virgifera virgifera]
MATENEQGDCPDDLESVEEEEVDGSKQLDFPNVYAALQSQRNAAMLALLPTSVKRRIKALKRIQLEATNIEAKFFKEVHNLECKYHKLYQPLYEKRNTIVSGQYEPTDEESQWSSDDESDLPEAIKEKIKLDDSKKETEPQDEKGVPDFWLTIFRNVGLLSEMVQPHDVPILKHLNDIKIICKEDPMKFILEFHFSTNEYFTNTVLTKEYDMKCAPEDDDPFSFEGPEIFKCAGCIINWNKGKNVTVKTVKKKQKHKSRGVIRTITKTVQNDSFFNFFSPPTIPDDAKEEDVDEDLRNLLTTDFEIGHYIRERIVPRAVLFFTGEACEDEDDFEEEEEEDDEEDDGDSDDKEVAAQVNKDVQNCKQQ